MKTTVSPFRKEPYEGRIIQFVVIDGEVYAIVIQPDGSVTTCHLDEITIKDKHETLL